MFKGKKVLITGGTGSLGSELTKRLLKTDVEIIRVYSRDEWKQVQMQHEISDKRLRFLIGDVRDKERLSRALEDVDIVIHAAALKQVPVVEYNPIEAVKTNVYGAQNLIEACLEKDVKIALAIGTDKAVSPFNTYGATKFLMERLFISANFMKGKHKTKFLCVRYGNVLGSRGSVLSIFTEQIRLGNKLTVTDPSMTRFNITMNQAIALIYRAIKNGFGGEVFVPKLKAYRLGDLKDSLLELLKAKNETKFIPVRAGEKIHESLIGKNELRNTYQTKNDYLIIDQQIQKQYLKNVKNIRKTTLKEKYSSDKADILTKNQLKEVLLKENLILDTKN